MKLTELFHMEPNILSRLQENERTDSGTEQQGHWCGKSVNWACQSEGSISTILLHPCTRMPVAMAILTVALPETKQFPGMCPDKTGAICYVAGRGGGQVWVPLCLSPRSPYKPSWLLWGSTSFLGQVSGVKWSLPTTPPDAVCQELLRAVVCSDWQFGSPGWPNKQSTHSLAANYIC